MQRNFLVSLLLLAMTSMTSMAGAHGGNLLGRASDSTFSGESDVAPPDPATLDYPLDAPARAGEHMVHAAYVLPYGRTAQADAVEKFRRSLHFSQDWYREQMERNGFGAKTFRLETEADGTTPKIHIVEDDDPTHDAAYYRLDPWARAGNAVSNAGFPVWANGQIWVIIFEAHEMNSDGSWEGGFNGGASWAGSGSDGGMAVTVGATLVYMTEEMMLDNRDYDGLTVPALGPYPMVQDVSAAWFDGTTLSSLSSVVHGIVLHELSHAFGTAHDFRNDGNFNGNMMGNGFRGTRGYLYPDGYPADYTRLCYGAALSLNYSRYFNPERTYTDNTKPSVTILNGPNASVEKGKISISFTATDESEMVVALLRHNYNLVDQMVLHGNPVADTFTTPYFAPDEENIYHVSVFDAEGNRGEGEWKVTPVTHAPEAFVRLTPSRLSVGEETKIEVFHVIDPDSDVNDAPQYTWDVDGDGVDDIGPSPDRSHMISYDMAGFYFLRVKAEDADGHVFHAAPVAVRVDPWQPDSDVWRIH